MLDYADDYERYAAITIPRYRKLCSDVVARRANRSSPPQVSHRFIPSSPELSLSGDTGRSDTESFADSVLQTPRSDNYIEYNMLYSPLTYLTPSEKLLTGEIPSITAPRDSGRLRTNLFLASALPGYSGDSCFLPLPPIGVLLAWHCHLMRPDIYIRGSHNAYKSLKGVPFPLHQAVSV